MSQRSVERALGKMVTDETFRNEFFRDPERASLHAGLDLLPDEIQALLKAPRPVLKQLGARLSDRICRLHCASPPGVEADMTALPGKGSGRSRREGNDDEPTG